MATGATAAVDLYGGRGLRFPIQRFRDGTLAPHVRMSDYATSSTTDPGSGTKAANHTAFTTAVNAAKAAALPLLIDGQFFDSSALPILGTTSGKGLQIQGRTPQLDSTYTASIMDGRVGDDDTTGSPSVGVVLGDQVANPTTSHAIELYGLRFEMAGFTTRSAGFGKYAVAATNLTSAKFIDLVIHGGNGHIVYNRGTAKTITRGVTACKSMADGITIQIGSGDDHLYEHNRVIDVQDDFLPVVGASCSNVTIRYNLCRGQTVAGTGCKVVGGRNIWIHHNQYERMRQIGLFIGRDAASSTAGSYDVLVEDNLLSITDLAVGSNSAIRILGYAGTASDGNLNNVDQTIIRRNVFNQFNFRMVLMGQDADAAAYCLNTQVVDNVLGGREDNATGTGDHCFYIAGTSGLTVTGNKCTRIGQDFAACISSAQIIGGALVFDNNDADINWSNNAATDVFNPTTAMRPDLAYTWSITRMRITSPNAWDKFIESGASLANCRYQKSTCTSAPDANDVNVHTGVVNGANGCVVD